MKLIPLSATSKSKKHKGKYFAKVDDADYEWLNSIRWWIQKRATGRLYAEGWVGGVKISMHRLILGLTDPKMYGDHIDHDTLNNQRDNLRKATHQQNSINKKSHNGSQSKYLGVHRHMPSRKAIRWRAKVTLNGKQFSVGVFKTEIEAAIARDKKAKELHGEFASLNFPNCM